MNTNFATTWKAERYHTKGDERIKSHYIAEYEDLQIVPMNGYTVLLAWREQGTFQTLEQAKERAEWIYSKLANN